MSLGNEFETDNNKESTQKRTNIINILIIVGVVLVVLCAIVLGLYLKKNTDYNNAIEMLDDNEPQKAAAIFEELDDYKESKEYLIECNYLMAKDLFDAGDYEESLKMFELLGEFEDSPQTLAESQNYIKYLNGKQLMDDSKFVEAQAAFSELKDFKDSAQMAVECRMADEYNQAVLLMESDDFEGAKQMFDGIPDYEDSAVLALVCSYKLAYSEAVQKAIDEEFVEAWEILREIKDDAKEKEIDLSLVADTKEFTTLRDECAKYVQYKNALIYYDEGKYFFAYVNFNKSGVLDWEDMANKCIQEFPSGEIYSNPDYLKNEATIIFRSDSEYTKNEIIKIYDGKTLVSMVAIKPGQRVKIRIPEGVYSVRGGAGTMWFGTEDYFGSDGYYYKVHFPSDSNFAGNKDKILLWSIMDTIIDIGESESGNLTNIEIEYVVFKRYD